MIKERRDDIGEIRLGREDEHYRDPTAGGCWICHGDMQAQPGGMGFDLEFDTHYHHYCLGYVRADSILDFESGDAYEE